LPPVDGEDSLPVLVVGAVPASSAGALVDGVEVTPAV
jgi:hypothetical protein